MLATKDFPCLSPNVPILVNRVSLENIARCWSNDHQLLLAQIIEGYVTIIYVMKNTYPRALHG